MNALADTIISRARELGATVAGTVRLGDLLAANGHHGFPIAEAAADEDSILVTGLDHPPSRPAMDWYTGRGGTEGNRSLMRINARLSAWLADDHRIRSRDLNYYAEKGGVFLKDAAVLAGLGVVGVNNLLLVPGYGPNIRLRALLIQAPLPTTGQRSDSPCEACPRPCLEVCPEGALTACSFDREACLRAMARDGAGNLVMDTADTREPVEVRFCRLCELVCPLTGDA